MSLNLVGTDGLTIRRVNTWMLRCYGCFTYDPSRKDRGVDLSTTKKMDVKFCPSCGGNTLLRTSISTSGTGEVKIHLKKSMQWTNRGTKVISFPPLVC